MKANSPNPSNGRWLKVPFLAFALGCVHHASSAPASRAAVLQPLQCRWNPAGPALDPPLRPSELARTCMPLVDDVSSAATGDFAPWAAPPRCAYPRKEADGKYCVFTYVAPPLPGGKGGGGISFTTTPENAAWAAGALREFAPGWAAEGGPSLHLSPFGAMTATSSGGADGKWSPAAAEVRKIPGKGFGVVALRRIAKDTVVLREAPFLVDLGRTLQLQDPREEGMVLQRALSQLPEGDRERVLDMARSGVKSDGDVLSDIMRTNVFGVVINGDEHSGLYPEVSRINHECKPSCFTRFDPRTLRMDVLAYRDIEAGEELSISYTALNLRSQDRRELLQRWGFNCTCPLCHSASATAVSNRNRNRIQGILDELAVEENRYPREVVDLLASEVFDLVAAEGLQAQEGEFAAVFGHVWLEMSYDKGRAGVVVGKDGKRKKKAWVEDRKPLTSEERSKMKDKARKYGERAVQIRGWYSGEDSEFTENARRFLENNFS